ncbi:MAG: hypothetical protein EOP52_11225 [Sphingobacteriales bacterium]|nr:MAG: hypothetical protein EOP52_11225 [Sphingobacteriales bacterium]
MDLTSHAAPHDSHDTHGHDSHGDHPAPVADARPNGATLNASFAVALLLAGLLIASVNFIGVMSSGHGDEKGTVHQTQDATSNQTLHGEDGLGADKPNPTQHHDAATEQDAAQREGHGH